MNAKNMYGETPLFCAADDGYFSVQLLWNNERLYSNPLFFKETNLPPLQINMSNKQNTVQFLLSKGSQSDITDNSGNTLLHAAARGGDLEIVNLLLIKGLDFQQSNSKQNTVPLRQSVPLHYAAFYCHASVIEFLLIKGADPDIQNADGKTPLQLAKEYCDQKEQKEAIVELFRRYGAYE